MGRPVRRGDVRAVLRPGTQPHAGLRRQLHRGPDGHGCRGHLVHNDSDGHRRRHRPDPHALGLADNTATRAGDHYRVQPWQRGGPRPREQRRVCHRELGRRHARDLVPDLVAGLARAPGPRLRAARRIPGDRHRERRLRPVRFRVVHDYRGTGRTLARDRERTGCDERGIVRDSEQQRHRPQPGRDGRRLRVRLERATERLALHSPGQPVDQRTDARLRPHARRQLHDQTSPPRTPAAASASRLRRPSSSTISTRPPAWPRRATRRSAARASLSRPR